MHDSTPDLIAGVHSDGSLQVYDRMTAQSTLSLPKLHSFEVWFL